MMSHASHTPFQHAIRAKNTPDSHCINIMCQGIQSHEIPYRTATRLIVSLM